MTLSHAHSMGEWNLDWKSMLISASPTALHCGFFRDDDALECTERFCCCSLFSWATNPARPEVFLDENEDGAT